MASPFPGMDPYLEQFWGDVHAALITYTRDQLQASLPCDLRARVQERVFVETPGGGRGTVYPDIRDDAITEGFIEIIDIATGRRVVTVIEVLSPSNKLAGAGQKLYLRKQKECLEGSVNLVEIDLLRAGPWVLSVPEHLVPESHRAPYRICVYCAAAERLWEVYRVSLRERLPAIKIPLRPTDADVPLDLQALIEQCYRNGGYDEDIDYQAGAVPPLGEADSRWADALLRNQQRRTGPQPRKPGASRQRPRKRKS